MKRINVLIRAIAVLLIVGGVLAFKVKLYTTVFCVKSFAAGPGICTGQLTGRQVQIGGTQFYGFVKQPGQICTQLLCLSVIRIDGEPDE